MFEIKCSLTNWFRHIQLILYKFVLYFKINPIIKWDLKFFLKEFFLFCFKLYIGSTMATTNKNVLFLFDVDGTLTRPREVIDQDVVDVLHELKARPDCTIALVGGSDYVKIVEQVKYPELFEYIFCENGAVAYKNNKLFHAESVVEFLGEEKLKRFLNYCLTYIANLDIPKKRGTFIELRKGLINVSPIGRNCTFEERKEFIEFDSKTNTLKQLQSSLIENFKDLNMKFAIGGQTSVDCFPSDWDKRNCLKHLEGLFSEILFFGDRTDKGGNDYEIYHDSRVKGHKVTSPSDTIKFVKEFLNSKKNS